MLFPCDVNEVPKIRLSERASEDHVAWLHEKADIFSVRRAYHLAARLEAMEQT
jgi:hypothetical protein